MPPRRGPGALILYRRELASRDWEWIDTEGWRWIGGRGGVEYLLWRPEGEKWVPREREAMKTSSILSRPKMNTWYRVQLRDLGLQPGSFEVRGEKNFFFLIWVPQKFRGTSWPCVLNLGINLFQGFCWPWVFFYCTPFFYQLKYISRLIYDWIEIF